jgi:cytidylate kinase
VWLDVNEETRAGRLAHRDGMELSQSLAHIRKRDSDNRARYKKVYGIDIFEHAGFDLLLNEGENATPDALADKIVNAYEKRKK